MKVEKVLHILRNPHEFTSEKRKEARISGAGWIERFKEAYENTRDWAEQNGVDTTAYHGPKPDALTVEEVNIKTVSELKRWLSPLKDEQKINVDITLIKEDAE